MLLSFTLGSTFNFKSWEALNNFYYVLMSKTSDLIESVISFYRDYKNTVTI